MNRDFSNPPTIDVRVISPAYYVNNRSVTQHNPYDYVFQSTHVPLQNKSFLSNSKKKVLCIIFSIIGTIVLIGLLIVLILYGLIPCKLATCHSRANVCINRPFRAQCICDYGYTGNGKTRCDECGLTMNQPNLRIIGGRDAIPNSWPSAVLVIQSYTGEYRLLGNNVVISISFICGGTLINHKSILTAAHCIKDSFEHMYQGVYYTLKIAPNKYYSTWESMYTVYVGVTDRRTMQGNTDGIGVSVDKIIRHESFDSYLIQNDLAILKLKTLVEPNVKTQFACLPNKQSITYPSQTTKAFIVGWGTTSIGGPLSTTLQNANITVYSPTFCSNVFPSLDKNWDSQICAGEFSGGRDSCQGDSGGSLFIKENLNGSTRYTTGGIVSYGDDCALRGKPGIYTRTSYFLDWILNNSDF